MCFSAEWSAFFAAISVVAAFIMHRKYGSTRHSIAILFFGSMELLQTVQYWYIAVPEDNWSMCGNTTNQFLTFIGYLHICFQPFFLNLALDAMWRRESLVGRLHNDLIQKLCLAGSVFLMGRYLSAIIFPEMLDTKLGAECPSTYSLSSGFDPMLQETPPNHLGFSCTYLSNSTTGESSGHLAWALPFSKPSYFVPNLAVHAFLMFAPSLVHPDPIARAGGLFLCLTGPVMAKMITPSLNEGAAVWCFFSMFQIVILLVASYFMVEKEVKFAPTIEHLGDSFSNELPMHYTLTSAMNVASRTRSKTPVKVAIKAKIGKGA